MPKIQDLFTNSLLKTKKFVFDSRARTPESEYSARYVYWLHSVWKAIFSLLL
jgi:hypothetical protein